MTHQPNALVLTPDTPIDLQLHTTFSDGKWLPEELIDYLVDEQFGLVAITDHDRVDTVETLQQLAAKKQLPLLAAVEMTTFWEGGSGVTDVLCYGVDSKNAQKLNELAQDILHRQQENTREVYENLQRRGIGSKQPDELEIILQKSCAQLPHELVNIVQKSGYEGSFQELFVETGFSLQANETAAVVEAAHESGALCLIAHPGRSDGFSCYDTDLLNQLRVEVPIDGIEVYYPAHLPEQIAMYEEYVKKHKLLASSGSDSHSSEKKPIKYRAELSRNLLERLGIQFK